MAAVGLGEIEFVEVTAAVEIELIGGACCCCKGKIRSISIALSKYSAKIALKFIRGHVIYIPAYGYKFQLKTTHK